jgi:hypothetical protein
MFVRELRAVFALSIAPCRRDLECDENAPGLVSPSTLVCTDAMRRGEPIVQGLPIGDFATRSVSPSHLSALSPARLRMSNAMTTKAVWRTGIEISFHTIALPGFSVVDSKRLRVDHAPAPRE